MKRFTLGMCSLVICASTAYNVTAGTDIYYGHEGKLRVSGMMNTSNVLGTPEDSAFLDLIVMIKLD